MKKVLVGCIEKFWSRRVCLTIATVFLPQPAWAQAASTGGIAGDCKDATGAVLPGVTVEVSSPALIEKVRTGCDRWRRQVQHPGSASRHIHRHF